MKREDLSYICAIILVLILFTVCVVGYILNIHHLYTEEFKLYSKAILQILGIIILPLGALLGYF